MGVELWDERYNIETKTELILSGNQFTGITLFEICNPTQLVVNLENNQLCFPYRSCTVMREKDTSGCD